MKREGARRGAKSIIGDVLRKVPLTGAAEIRVPSDIRKVLVANIENMRESAVDIFANEISKLLSRVDFQQIVGDVLKNYTLRVDARFELVPKGQAAKKEKKGKK